MSGASRWVVPAAVRRAIVDHARRERPRECCGFLVGAAGDVRYAVAMVNVAAAGPRRYRIDDRDHIALRRALRAFTPALEIVGVYHSHPGGRAVPSPTDLAEAHYPDWLYLIVGFVPAPALAGFRIAAGVARRVPLASGARRRGAISSTRRRRSPSRS